MPKKRIKKVKLVAWNSRHRRWEEVFPEDEVTPDECVPLYLTRDGQYVSIPESPAREAQNEIDQTA